MAITATVELENLSIDEPALHSDDVISTRFGNPMRLPGGTLSGSYGLTLPSSEESQSISAVFHRGLFSASAKMKLEEVQKKHQSDIRITVYHEGGPIDLSMDDLTDANQLYVMLQK